MSEVDTTPAEAPETASLEEVQTDLQATTNYDDQDFSENEETAEEPTQEELDEWEKDGKKYKIPKDLKPHLMKDADYTRKTQEVAEERKRLEAAKEAFASNAKLQEQTVKDIASVHAVDERLAAYQKIDWRKLEADDAQNGTNVAFTRFRELSQLQQHRQTLVSRVQQSQAQIRSTEQRDFAKRVEEGQQVLAREIPGWSPDLATKLLGFAKQKGIPDSTINRFQDDPHAVKLLHGAYLADQLISKQQQAARTRPAPSPAPSLQIAPAAAPVTQVTKGRSAAPVKGLDDRLSAEEWTRRRNEQLRRRA